MTYSDADNVMRMYYDGQLKQIVAARERLSEPRSVSVSIGADFESRRHYWHGAIDEVGIFIRVKHRQELRRTMHISLSGDEPGFAATIG
jgi:hypothetical protein